jgi:trehalose-6-phosphate synthase
MVSYEYVACQSAKKGVLAMSQYAGAAKTLPSSIIFNPWDTPRFACMIKQILTMPDEERERRYKANAKIVDKWTSVNWGTSFLETLVKMELPEAHRNPPDGEFDSIMSADVAGSRDQSRGPPKNGERRQKVQVDVDG